MMPVMDAEGKGIVLDFRQVVYVEREKRNLIYHTRTDEYRPITSIDIMSQALEPLGFRSLEIGSNVVDMSAIKKYDQTFRQVYFDYDLNELSKRVHVSRGNIPFINEYIREHAREISVIYHKNGGK